MAPVLTSPLVSTQWLADHLGADELVVLDASVHTVGAGFDTTWLPGRDAHEQRGHVPGARFADLIDAFSAADADVPFTRPGAERFEAAAGQLGVTNTSTVVIYDDSVGEWSARLWWIFRSFGFDSVAVLDGGFTKWRDEGRPVRVGALRAPAAPSGPDAGAFLAGEERALWADHDRVTRAVSGEEPASLVFAASWAALGDDHPPIVPGSTPITADSLVDPETERVPARGRTRAGLRRGDRRRRDRHLLRGGQRRVRRRPGPDGARARPGAGLRRLAGRLVAARATGVLTDPIAERRPHLAGGRRLTAAG
ncbi:rhodanese-like domain-containing protein [Curtobacterium flaccumfaciens]|nr:rhodanese-like domain-containing protein [Curtobacterium flaccumfaciens]